MKGVEAGSIWVPPENLAKSVGMVRSLLDLGDHGPDGYHPASALTTRQFGAHNSPGDSKGNATPRLSPSRPSTR